MHQCSEGWHRTDEPERDTAGITEADESGDDEQADTADITSESDGLVTRRVRSTRRRQDVPDLPQVPMDDRTVGVVFRTPEGREYRPSMFLTLTLPSYGPVNAGVPVDMARYDYRRAALDAILFPRLVDQFWKTLRRCAGFDVQYFSAVEPQHRLAPHLHAAIRGAVPRKLLRQVAQATYLQVWWPSFDHPIYTDRLPEWTGNDYADLETGELLPTWTEALDAMDAEGEGPAHVMRFGDQLDIQGIIRSEPDADRAIRYLTKYITKDTAATHPDAESHPAYQAHVDRFHAELRYLPCSERCANWLRYGIQPKAAVDGLVPGSCTGKAHRRENLGLGGRRVLVSRKWSSKTLARHRADRASVVREALATAGIVAPDTERLAATVTGRDGQPRYRWEQADCPDAMYAQVVMLAIAERRRWRTEYEQARTLTGSGIGSAIPP